jgi:hypothetical protein
MFGTFTADTHALTRRRLLRTTRVALTCMAAFVASGACVTRQRTKTPPVGATQRTLWVALDDAVVLASRIEENWLTHERRSGLTLLRRQREDPSLELAVPEDAPLTQGDVHLPQELRQSQGDVVFVWSQEVIDSHRSGLAGASARTFEAPCRATVTQVGIRNVADASFESVRSVWADSLAGVVVLGHLSAPCPGALFATTTRDLVLYRPEAPEARLLRSATSAFLSDPERRRCAESTLQTSLFTSRSGQVLLVVTGFDADKEAGYTVFFEAAPTTGALRLLAATRQDLTVQVAIDSDDDGRLELVLGPDGPDHVRHLFFSASGSLLQAFSSPSFVCPG